MVGGYVSKVGTLKSTGDMVMHVEIIKENIASAFPLNLLDVVVMTRDEYFTLIDSIDNTISQHFPSREELTCTDTVVA